MPADRFIVANCHNPGGAFIVAQAGDFVSCYISAGGA
jgi:hypothetical protein